MDRSTPAVDFGALPDEPDDGESEEPSDDPSTGHGIAWWPLIGLLAALLLLLFLLSRVNAHSLPIGFQVPVPLPSLPAVSPPSIGVSALISDVTTILTAFMKACISVPGAVATAVVASLVTAVALRRFGGPSANAEPSPDESDTVHRDDNMIHAHQEAVSEGYQETPFSTMPDHQQDVELPLSPGSISTDWLELRRFDGIEIRPALDHLVGSFDSLPQGQRPGEIVISDLYPDWIEDLADLPDQMSERKHDAALYPVLVGVPQCEPSTVRDLVESYDTILLVDEKYRGRLRPLLEVLPAVSQFSPNQRLRGVGAATYREIPTDELRRRTSDKTDLLSVLANQLIDYRGLPLHQYGASLREEEDPRLVAITAPPAWTDLLKKAFADQDVEAVVAPTANSETIRIVQFYLEDSLTTGRFPDQSATPDIDWDQLPQPPTPDPDTTAPNPRAVTIDPSVLDEMAAHALSDPGREVYGLIYAQDNRIEKYHPIQSEEHVLRKPRKVSFTGNFKEHVRRLASLYDEFGLRLVGDCHSHPMSGVPTPSDADLRSFKKFWRNDRNTYFIIGLDSGAGPNTWTQFEGGHELRRRINDQLVRIKAYNVNGENKKLRLHPLESESST